MLGSIDVSGLMLKVLVIDPESQTVIDTDEIVMDLLMEEVQGGQALFSTQGYELGTYNVKLQYIYEGATRSMAVTSLTVRDGTPPDISILHPDNVSDYSFEVNIAVVVTDNTSGVERVEYRLDGGLWRLLPVADLSNGKYSTTWIPAELSDEGAHSVSFRAFDRAGNVSDTIASLFTVEFIPPIADAGADQNVVTGEFVTLDGSGSYDPEGEMLSLLWTFTEVPAGSIVSDASLSDATSAKPTFTTDIDGTYVLELVVNDGKKQGLDAVSIVASTPNVPPNSDAGTDHNGSTGSTVNLDGSGSNDPDNRPQPLTYSWRFIVLPLGSQLFDDDITDRYNVTAGFIPDVDGEYVLELMVSDGELSSIDNVTIISLTPNVPPNADAGDDIAISLGETAVLDGSASYDADNGPQLISYSWRFVVVPNESTFTNDDIADAYTVSPSFVPDKAGTYVLELMVEDGLDAGFDNSAVTVIAVPSISVSPTSIDFGDADLNITSEGRTVTVTNDAPAALLITGISIAGANANEFNATSDCGTIGSGSSCIIDVVFTPLSLGAGSGLLNISSNDPNSPTTVVPLSGNGVDITSPEISAVADRDTLWPPNHKMVNITIEVYTTDNSGLSVILSAEVQSNELVNGGGDGNTSPDWTEPVIDQDTGIINLQLRSERSGGGDGRIYTITITATDITGNSSSVDLEVTVPYSND